MNYIKTHTDYDKDDLVDFFINEYTIRAREYLLGALTAISMFEALDNQGIDLIKKKLNAHIDQIAESIKITFGGQQYERSRKDGEMD